MQILEACDGDARRIAEVHVRSWKAAYRGILPDPLLDGLSVDDRERSWHALLSGDRDRWLTFVAEGTDGLAGFCSMATPSLEAGAGEKTAEIAALYVDPEHWREEWAVRFCRRHWPS